MIRCHLFFFNIVADMLAVLIEKAKDGGQVGSLIPHLVEGGVSILQYADDTILFLEHDLEKATNMKLILALFEQLSGLKINFQKSELYCFGKAKEEQEEYRAIFGCEIGTLPFKYLGIPIHYRNYLIRNGDPLRIDLKKKWVHGQARCSHMVIVLS